MNSVIIPRIISKCSEPKDQKNNHIAFKENFPSNAFPTRQLSLFSHIYLFQFNITNPARQTKIPKIFTHEILSLKKKIPMGAKINAATTVATTAAMPKFQPAR